MNFYAFLFLPLLKFSATFFPEADCTDPDSDQEDPDFKTECEMEMTDFNKKMAVILDRGKVSSRDAFRIVTSVIQAGKSDLRLSYTGLMRLRKATRFEEARKIRENFKPTGPLTIHFDGLKMKPLSGQGEVFIERLPVVVSGSSFILIFYSICFCLSNCP